jgi:hypothetical protein
MERRPIRITYRFGFEGRDYRAIAANVGETIDPDAVLNETRMSAVCHALDIDGDEFVARWGEPWYWEARNWKRAGIIFDYAYDEEARKQTASRAVACQRCGKKWIPRGKYPSTCPNSKCHSTAWDRAVQASDPGKKRRKEVCK